MADCPAVCPREIAGLGLYEAPRVEDDEWVCRTVRPEDYNTKNALKPSFVSTTRLRAGELSAWRLPDLAKLSDLKDKLAANGQAPDNILAVQADALRRIAIGTRSRCLSVINDTRVDDEGGHDPQHIAIAPCADLMASSDPDLVTADLKVQIRLVYRSTKAVALHPRPEAA